MAFPARYDFTCTKCLKQGKRGDLISWSRKQKGVVYHDSCAPESKDIIKTEIDPENPHRDVESAYRENETVTSHLKKELKTDEKEKTIVETVNAKDENALDVFARSIAPQVQKHLKGSLDDDQVKKLIAEALEKVSKPRTIEVKNIETKEVSRIENPHKNIETLLYYIQKRHHVYLYGPAGSGKSTASQQVAEALQLPYGYISLNPQTPDSRLLGFIDAGGTYRETPFFKCYKNGGVFCIDELDNASASLLTTLNSMLENGVGAFPGVLVPRHKDFVLVATGNTNGRGANPMFPERRPFDVAFAERFTFLFWDYDTHLEKKITLLINPKAEQWLEWILRAREYVTKNFPKVLISPRASFKGAEYLKDDHLKPKEIAEAVIFKGLEKETITKIFQAVPLELKK